MYKLFAQLSEQKHLEYVHASENYSVFCFSNDTQVISITLKKICQKMPHLVRIHRSYAINPEFVSQWLLINPKIGPSRVLMKGGYELPISRRYAVTLLKQRKNVNSQRKSAPQDHR